MSYLKDLSEREIEARIYFIRGQSVMLDSDLADLYQVQTKRINEQVKRNHSRFPIDFMFQLTQNEWSVLKSQIATSRGWGGRRNLPYAFTEHGVLMHSSVLNSESAIQVNILIMRTYTKMRQLLMDSKDLILKVANMEHSIVEQGRSIELLFDYLERLSQKES